STGTTVIYSQFVGGTGDDVGKGIDLVGTTGTAPVVAGTTTGGFPQNSAIPGSTSPGFVAEYNTAGTGFVFSSYLGLGSTDQASGIAADANNNLYVAGQRNGGTGFLTKILLDTQPPVITSISTDTGAASTDGITTDQTLSLSGTALAGSTVKVYRQGTYLGSTTADG